MPEHEIRHRAVTADVWMFNAEFPGLTIDAFASRR